MKGIQLTGKSALRPFPDKNQAELPPCHDMLSVQQFILSDNLTGFAYLFDLDQ